MISMPTASTKHEVKQCKRKAELKMNLEHMIK